MGWGAEGGNGNRCIFGVVFRRADSTAEVWGNPGLRLVLRGHAQQAAVLHHLIQGLWGPLENWSIILPGGPYSNSPMIDFLPCSSNFLNFCSIIGADVRLFTLWAPKVCCYILRGTPTPPTQAIAVSRLPSCQAARNFL